MADEDRSKQQAIGSNIVQADRGGQAILEIKQEAPLEPVPALAPNPPWYFTGREEQIKHIVGEITDEKHLSIIAILGMGGIGKTALAKQIGEDLKSRFPGGIFWGDELPSNDSQPSIILRQWGRLCGQNLEKENEENLPAIVRGLLMARCTSVGPLLIIVDDVRLDWQGGIEVLKHTLPPRVPLIITTRRAQVAQEIGAEIFHLEVLSRSESVQLLLTLSDGKIGKVQGEKIAELCGDMPLAVELMAKLAKSRKVDWLLKRLENETNRLNFLKLDAAIKKEQSVKISLDISYQALLEQYPETARMFRYLAVFEQPTFMIYDHFVQSFVGGKKQKSRAQHENEYVRSIEDELLRLVDWSLLIEDKGITNEEMQYFQLHALLHEYAQSLLVDPIETNEAIRAHIRYCVAFAQANPNIDLQKQQDSTFEFERSYGQLLQALTQIKDLYIVDGENWQDDPELAQQIATLVNVLDKHWQLHSQFEQQIDWLQVAYKCVEVLHQPLRQADFARRLGRVLSWQGRLDDALDWMGKAENKLGENESEEATAIRALMYIHRASIYFQKDDLETAEDNCIRGLKLVDKRNYPSIFAEGYNLFGGIKILTNKLSSALEAFEKSLSVWKSLGDRYQIYRVEDNVRTTLYYMGDIAHLRAAEDASVNYWEKFPDRIELAMALTNRGLVHHIDGEYEIAIEYHKRAMDISDLLSVPRIQALTRVNIAWPYIALEKFDKAEKNLKQSLEYDVSEYLIDTKRCLVEIEIGREHYKDAIEIAENALKLVKEDENPLEKGYILRVLGQAQHLQGNLEQARKNLETSLFELRESEYKYESFLTLQALAKLYETMGEEEKAQATATESQTLAREMGLRT